METESTTQPTTTNGGYWGSDGQWYPGWDCSGYTYYIAQSAITEPASCIGLAHVFECNHAKACKCGKVKRSNPERLDKEK